MVGIATGPHLRNFDWVRANGSGNGKSRKNYPIIQGRHLLEMIGRALMLIFTTSKPFLPCNAMGIMLKFRNYR